MVDKLIAVSNGSQLAVVNAAFTAQVIKSIADTFTPDFDRRLLLHRALRHAFGDMCFSRYCVDMSNYCRETSSGVYHVTFLRPEYVGRSPPVLRFGGAPARFAGNAAADFFLDIQETPRIMPGRLRKSGDHNYYLGKELP